MDTTRIDSPDPAAAVRPPDHRPREPAFGLLLPALWLLTALGMVVVPFLTQYRVVSGSQDEAIEEGFPDVELEYTVNGWGQWDGLEGGHDIRTGILFAAIAALLILAVAATLGWRRARWPMWLGLLASTMAVTASVLCLAELEARWYIDDLDDSTFRSDVTLGLGTWLVPVLGVLAVIAVALSLVRIRRQRRRTSQRPTSEASLADRQSFVLPGLWTVTAAGLAVAPFLTVYEVRAVDSAAHVGIDGWSRTEGWIGAPCAILAIGLVAAAVAMTVRRTAILPLRIGLLAGTGAVVVGAFQLLSLDSLFDTAGPSLTVAIGIGGWLVLAAGVLAAATVVLTLVRQWRRQAADR